jgi:hypothetical protein
MVVSKRHPAAAWLLLTFTLPTKSASQRVGVWRKLQRYGSIPLGNSGYLLPNNPTNQERFEWLATSIRKHPGEASVVSVQSIDNLSTPQLIRRFSEARTREYQELIQELQELSTPRRTPGTLNRLRAKFLEIVEVDFFGSPIQKRVQELLSRAEKSPGSSLEKTKADPRLYVGRTWVTRHRPGIDRSASAWLIQRFIDRKARFTFASEGDVPRDAVPYDMFHEGGFGHQGDDCTFETLRKEFRVPGAVIGVIGEVIHDADLLDDKFGRKEGFGIDEVLKGWAKQGVPDDDLLKRGIQLTEALYRAFGAR